MNNLSFTVKMLRKQYNLTQEELSLKSGVGLRFVRDLEQGKETLRLDRMSLLLTCCKDCIGAVSVIPIEEKEESHV